MGDRARATRQDLEAMLARLGLAFTTHEHEAVFTVAQSEGIKADMPGGHTKNLFLKDKKGAFILISALATTTIALKGLHRELGCARLSFGSAVLLEEILGVTPGSVTAFALINDPGARVRFVIDGALMAHDPINFHPLHNTATTAISPDDFLTFARACGHEPEIFDFSAPPPDT
jgi:Ala-tRNA(Pro) deacylase